MATQKEVADHLDIGERQVRNLLKEGVLPSSKGKGGLNFDDCRKAYINYLRGQKTGQVKKGADDEEAELGDVVGGINVPFQEARKKQLDADTREYKLHILRKEYAPIELLTFALSQMATSVVAGLNTLPMKVKLADPAIKGRSLDAIGKQTAEICNEIADFELDLSGYTPVDQEFNQEGL